MYSLTARAGIQAAWEGGRHRGGDRQGRHRRGDRHLYRHCVRCLDKDDKLIDGPDLSFDSQTTGPRYLDGFGHGMHLAGIIAGKDYKFDTKKPSTTQFSAVAPDAKLLNMKVAMGDGGSDVSQVIAAFDWVVQNRNDDCMNVRVINLAYGTDSKQPWQVDPLARAVENAWNPNLLVVTAAGNDGLDARTLLMPAVDLHVLAVGAVDHLRLRHHARRPGRRLHQWRQRHPPPRRAGPGQVGGLAACPGIVRRRAAPRRPSGRRRLRSLLPRQPAPRRPPPWSPARSPSR